MAKKIDITALGQPANKPAGSAGEEKEELDNQQPKRGVGRPQKYDPKIPMRTISVKISEDTYEKLQMLIAMLLVKQGNKTNLSEYVNGLICQDLERHEGELEAFLGGK